MAADGSSPHTRGAHHRVDRDGYRVGIIPAYAGSTSAIFWSICSTTDHPRIRGEHEGGGERGVVYAGSSPHTRGAQYLAARAVLRIGIIPAYAGSTWA